MKVADYIVRFLEESNFRFAAGVSGGAIMHLMHSLQDSSKIETIFTHHEQAAAMAVDGFNRASPDQRGLVFATSGPGATNLLTGLAGAYYDSTPLFAITGQASTFRQVGESGVRQVGFQETPIVEMAGPVTKYARKISTTSEVPGALLLAIEAMEGGRKGPVLLDIPDDILRSEIRDAVPIRVPNPGQKLGPTAGQLSKITELVRSSERPVIVLGAGLNSSPRRAEVVDELRKLGIPVLLTWGAADLLPKNNELYVGLFGTHGQRLANFVVQASDLLISLGSRLDTKSTGTPVQDFAPKAKKILVDIDSFELNKFQLFGLKIDLKICADAFSVLSSLARLEIATKAEVKTWKRSINEARELLKGSETSRRSLEPMTVSPKAFFEAFSNASFSIGDFVLDTGNTLGWFLSYFTPHSSQRLWHDFNNTAMGWSIPAALGIGKARGSKVAVVVGDGSIMMALGDLVTLRVHHPSVKVFVINNGGYSMIRQTQDQWFNSKFIGSDKNHLSFPSFREIAIGTGYEYQKVSSERELDKILDSTFKSDGAFLVEVMVDSSETLSPQLKFGNRLQDLDPPLAAELTDRISGMLG